MNHLLAFCELLAILASAYGWGHWLAGFFRFPLGRFEGLVCRIALGWGAISYLTLAAAALGLIRFPFFLLTLAVGILWLWKSRQRLEGVDRPLPIQWNPATLFLSLLLAINFFYALFPPIFYDSMLYHLAAPAYYLQHGKIVAWPTHFTSNFPFAGEMLFLFAMLGKTLYLPKLLVFASGILLLVWLCSWVSSRPVSWVYLMPGVLVYSIPEVGFLASSSKTDMLGFLYFAIGVRLFYIALDSQAPGRSMVLPGIFLGMAMATKYTFAFPIVGMVCSLLLMKRVPWPRKVKAMAMIGICIGLIMLPWLAKNVWLTGNPVYPYLSGLFPSANWSPVQSASFSQGLKRGAGGDLGKYLRFPLEMFLKPYRYGITAVMGVLYLLCFPLLFFAEFSQEERFLLLAALFSFFLLLAFARVPRYFLPSLIMLSIPIAGVIGRVWRSKRRINYLFIAGFFLAATVNLLQQVELQEKTLFAFRFIQRRVLHPQKYAGLKYLHSLSYYRAAEYANAHLQKNDLLAFLGEERTFYFHRPHLASSFNDRNPLLEAFRVSRSYPDFASRIRRMGITHVLFCPLGWELMEKKSPMLYGLPEEGKNRLTDYLRQMTLLYMDPRYQILRVDSVQN